MPVFSTVIQHFWRLHRIRPSNFFATSVLPLRGRKKGRHTCPIWVCFRHCQSVSVFVQSCIWQIRTQNWHQIMLQFRSSVTGNISKPSAPLHISTFLGCLPRVCKTSACTESPFCYTSIFLIHCRNEQFWEIQIVNNIR